ncbi:Inosine-5'-monophosphate dehydrogenase [bacterium HR37]|nr:Inosine-5'-monophosphate dehydrogenase [bacterium HR37]
MKVKDIMSYPVIVAREETTLREIAGEMLKHKIGAMPVVDVEGKIVGIITDSDFAAKERGFPFSTFFAPQVFGRWMPKEDIEKIYEEVQNLRAKDIMTSPVITASEEEEIEEAVEKMLKYDFNHLPVVRDGVPVGMLSRHDLLKLILRNKSR